MSAQQSERSGERQGLHRPESSRGSDGAPPRPYIDQERSVTDHWSDRSRASASRAIGTVQAPAPVKALPPAAATTPARELRRVVAADALPRRLAAPVTMAQLFLRLDATHDLPHVVETETGRIVARFEKAGDVALFIGTDQDRKTLPADYVMQLCGGQ